ncbi:MAG: OmpA family protein [Acidobacteriota bacterium]
MIRKRAVTAVAIVVCLSAPAQTRAEDRQGSWDVSPYFGVLAGSDALGNDTDPVAGIRIGYHLNRWWGVEVSYGLTNDLDVRQSVGNRVFSAQDQFGVSKFQFDDVQGRGETDIDFTNLNILLSTPRLKRRWVAYVTGGLGIASFDGTLTQRQVDEAFPQGPAPIPDALDLDNDGDLSELIDQFRCPTCDKVLLDPNDPKMTSSFAASGRSLDSFDTTQFNIGAGVRIQLTDAIGVRLDLRNLSGISRTYNALIFSSGLVFRFGGEAPIDDDEDGIPTFRDHCEETPSGATVDHVGCPSDTDGDDILDGLDACPSTPAGWPVDDKGCPLDTDGDGVPDGRDTCKTTPTGAVVDFEGCAVDADGDGVPDGIDQCALTPKGAVVDETGCPVDSDKDGVADGIDQCAKTPSDIPVDAMGCPVDSDGDGLKDDVDACRQFGGPGGVDEEGCPRFRLDKLTRLSLPAVRFAPGASTLAEEARGDLDALVAALQYYSTVTIEIQGHTDSVGSERDNFLVSMERAGSVRRWLTDAGISADRIRVKGYGEVRPIADNSTEEGRAKNRRIEILVTGTLDESDAGTGNQDSENADQTP